MKDIYREYCEGDTSKRPFVFIHGDMQNFSALKNLEKIFREKGHTTLGFDLPGHGRSEFTEEGKDLIRIVSEIIGEHGVSDPVLVGQSSGGVLAVEYFRKTRNASALVLINSPLDNPKVSNPDIDWGEIEGVYQQWSRDSFRKRGFIDYSKDFKDEGEIKRFGLETTQLKGLQNNFDFYCGLGGRQDLGAFDIPVLFVSSETDVFAPLEYVKERSGGIDRSRVEVVDGSHNMHILNRKEVCEALERNYNFLVGQSAE